MFRYSTLYVNIVSFFISCIIFFIINIFFSNYSLVTKPGILKVRFEVDNKNIQVDTTELGKNTEEDLSEMKTDEWYLEIPCIELKANIQEGTTKEIMDKYIGHFEDTSKDIGNIGLAAHNRGYENNYFENLKKIKEGDEIYYNYNGTKRKYRVTKELIITDTDWTNLEDTEENTITLITCVENQPEYRRCVQGKEE